MKNYNNILAKISVVLALMSFISCQDLIETPVSSVAPANYFNTPEQCETVYTNSMYALFSQWGGYGQGLYMGQMSDQFDGGNFNYNINIGSEYWSAHFKAINMINSVLSAIETGKMASYPTEIKDDIIAQGRFLRAFNYFYLVRLFGKVPYLTEDRASLITVPLTPEDRDEISDVYDKIEADLLYAADKLKSSNLSKINKWIAKALLAKVYLTRATAPLKDVTFYTKAKDMANTIITSGPYVLESSVDSVFHKNNRKNLEIIFAFNSAKGNTGGSASALCPLELEGDQYTTVPIQWTNKYPEQPRKSTYIMLNWPKSKGNTAVMINYTQSKGQKPCIGKLTWPYFSYNAIRAKAAFEYDRSIIRLADIYLVYAEAQNRSDGGANATSVQLVNNIINRANAGKGTEALVTLGMTMTDFENRVIEERNLELCFEGDRYYDCVRKELFETVCDSIQLNGFAPYKYLYPIPAFEAKFIGQNSGYE
jgi:hypothetical protein